MYNENKLNKVIFKIFSQFLKFQKISQSLIGAIFSIFLHIVRGEVPSKFLFFLVKRLWKLQNQFKH